MAGVFKRRRRHNVLSCRNGRRSVFNREHFGAADLSAGDEISVGCYGSKLIREEDVYRLGAYSKLLTKT